MIPSVNEKSMNILTTLWRRKFAVAVAVVATVYAVQVAFFTLPRANAAATVTI